MLASLPGEKRLLGAMLMVNRTGDRRRFGRDDVKLFETLGRPDRRRRSARTGWPRKVAELRDLQAQLEHQAFHDPLTGLANRLLFMDRVEHTLQRRNGNAAVLYVDLDDFKPINDTYGHEAGDAVLKAAAERLRKSLRTADTAARLGGDEFAVLLVDIAEEHIGVVADRIISNLLRPLEFDGRLLDVKASLGRGGRATPAQASAPTSSCATPTSPCTCRSTAARAASATTRPPSASGRRQAVRRPAPAPRPSPAPASQRAPKPLDATFVRPPLACRRRPAARHDPRARTWPCRMGSSGPRRPRGAHPAVEVVRLAREDPPRLGREANCRWTPSSASSRMKWRSCCVERRGRHAPASGDLDRREAVESHLRDGGGGEAERHLRVVRHRGAVEDVEEDVLCEVRLGEDALRALAGAPRSAVASTSDRQGATSSSLSASTSRPRASAREASGAMVVVEVRLELAGLGGRGGVVSARSSNGSQCRITQSSSGSQVCGAPGGARLSCACASGAAAPRHRWRRGADRRVRASPTRSPTLFALVGNSKSVVRKCPLDCVDQAVEVVDVVVVVRRGADEVGEAARAEVEARVGGGGERRVDARPRAAPRPPRRSGGRRP